MTTIIKGLKENEDVLKSTLEGNGHIKILDIDYEDDGEIVVFEISTISD